MMDRYEYSTPTMGTILKLVVYAPAESDAQRFIGLCLDEIERLIPILNNYSSKSEISQLNNKFRDASGASTPVSADLYRALLESKRWHDLSGGVFDVTCGSLFELWKQARKSQRLPSQEERRSVMEACGWQHVELSEEKGIGQQSARGYVKIKHPGLVLDLSGIATGFIIDAAVGELIKAGCRCFLIDIGGDIRIGEAPPSKPGWNVQIGGLQKDSPAIMQLVLTNCSVTTSGDRNQSYSIDGVWYSHLLDPRVGFPLTNSQSCTVISAKTTDADAGATTLSILGRSESAKVFARLPLERALLLYKDNSDPKNPTADTVFTSLNAIH